MFDIIRAVFGDVFEKEKIVTVCMSVCFLLSILIRCVIGGVYHRMIKETDNMGTTRNKLLKQCKLKYSNCCKLNGGVPNTPVYVEKFLNKLSFGPLPLEMLYHLSGQLMLLSVVFSGVGICRRIIAGSLFGEIIPFYIVSFLGLYLYFSLSAIIDVPGRRGSLKTNLIDYLENHLASRIEVTDDDMQRLYGRRAGRGHITRENGRTVDLIPIDGGRRGSREDMPKAVGAERGSEKDNTQGAGGADASGIDQDGELDRLLQELLL